MKMSGNTILVTGATSGIGRAFAVRFAELGNAVIACGRRKERLDALRAEHPDIVARVCDIADEGQRAELASWAAASYPQLNVLINNAGIQLTADLTRRVDLPRVRSEIETNLVAPIHLEPQEMRRVQQTARETRNSHRGSGRPW